MSTFSPVSVLFTSDSKEVAIAPGVTSSTPVGFFSIGIDSNGVARIIKTDASGGITLASGSSITANIGTTNGLALDNTLSTFSSTYSTRTPTLGQKTMSGSVPVVFASDQTLNVNESHADLVFTGTMTSAGATASTTALDGYASLSVQLTGTFSSSIQFEVTDDGNTWVAINGRASGSGTTTTIPDAPGLWSFAVAGFKFFRLRTISYSSGTINYTIRTSGVTGSISIHSPLPAGTNTIGSITGPGAAGAAVSGNPVRIGASDGANTRNILSDTSGRLIIVGTGASSEVAISASSIPLPTGASTESTLLSLSGKFGSLGQKNMAGSAPVVISSDQSSIPVSGTITANVGTTNGIALDATLTGGTQVSKIGNGTITAQLLASAPAGTENALVVRNIPSGTQTVSANSLPLPTGASTETTLSGLSAKFGSLGQKTMAGSTPVVISSDQSALPITGSITATNASVGSTGSTVPTSATLLGGTDGSLLRAIKLASDGTQLIQGLGIAGTASGGILTIQGIAGGTAVPCSVSSLPLPTGAATESTLISGSQRTKLTDGTNNVAVLTADAVGTEAGLAVRQVGRSIVISESEHYLQTSDFTNSGVCWGETTTSSTAMKLISTNTVGQLTTTGINTFTVVSSSTSDSSAGTGARTLLVISVDSNGNKAAHTITLTGTTAVSVSRTNVVAIEYMEVITAGSGFANAGTITATANGTTLMTMVAAANTTQTGVHYIPSGMKCYIYNLAASTKGNSIYIDLYKSAYMATGVKMIQLLPSLRCTTTGTASVSANFSTPFVIPNSSGMPMKIEMYVTADSNTAATINSSFTFIDR